MSNSSKSARFIQAYRFVSVIVFNTILILLILNFFAWMRLTSPSSQYKPEYFLNRQEVYPGYTPDDIALLMKETWYEPFQYEPWVGFKEKPRAGKFVNISKEGFRYSHRKEINLKDDGLKIYVFGGSTTFGYGVDDASTIPAYLEKRIASAHADKKIQVFNFGRAYYYSTQELALLLQLLRNGHRPDIAIFIDGWNESPEAPYYTGEMSFLFDAYNYSPDKLKSIVMEQIPLIRYVQTKVNIAKSKRQISIKTTFRKDPVDIRNEYLQNREIMNMLAAQYRFSAYFFIHPAPGYRNSYAKHKFWKQRSTESVHEMRKKMELLETTTNHQNAFSMTDLLADYRKQPFVDEIHFTPEVCDLLAGFIAQKIYIP
jgi:hypothetical protein